MTKSLSHYEKAAIYKICRVEQENLGLGTRACTRVPKSACTIADLDGEVRILPSHVAEAIQYRNLDRCIL